MAPPAPGRARELAERFLAAAVGGDLAGLLDLLAPGGTVWFDADGRHGTPAGAAARRQAVAEYLVWVAPFRPPRPMLAVVPVGDGPGGPVMSGGRPFACAASTSTRTGSPRCEWC